MSKQQYRFAEGERIRATIRMLIPVDKHGEAIQILSGVQSQIRFEPSCISSGLYRSVDEDRAIMFEALWESGPDLLEYLKSDVFRRVLLVIEMSEEPPDIRFDTITSFGGIEVIEQARSQG